MKFPYLGICSFNICKSSKLKSIDENLVTSQFWGYLLSYSGYLIETFFNLKVKNKKVTFLNVLRWMIKDIYDAQQQWLWCT